MPSIHSHSTILISYFYSCSFTDLQITKFNRCLCRNFGIVIYQLNIGFKAVASSNVFHFCQQKRRRFFAMNSFFSSLFDSFVDGSVYCLAVHGIFLWNWVCNQHTCMQTTAALCCKSLCKFLWCIQLVIYAKTASSRVEGRQLLSAIKAGTGIK